MALIREQLEAFKAQWNLHRIRRRKDGDAYGIPSVLYSSGAFLIFHHYCDCSIHNLWKNNPSPDFASVLHTLLYCN